MSAERPGPFPVRFPELPDDQDPVTVLWRRAVPWAYDDGVFAQQLLGTGPSPDQGWKLHVAASAASAPVVLERALPVLLAAGARFKVVRSRELLLAMNNGAMRAPQVGKFVTVYPADDAQAVDLAVALDEATAGLAGPRVPTDRPLRPGSLVHYRYGSFRHRRDLDAAPDREGVGGPDLLDAAGRLTVDVRAPHFTGAPPGIADPFEAAGVVAAAPPASAGFAGRYLVHEVLGRSWRGGVYRAIDVRARPVRAVLLKEFWHDVGADRYGREAPDWGRHEAEILQRHDGDPAFPRFLDTFESDGNLFVALEHVDGDAVLAAVPGNGERAAVAVGDLLSVARATAAALAHLHAVGVVFRDVKPSNVLRTPDGGWRLVDFGIAHELASHEPPFGGGTEPFASPQQGAGEPPQPSDDVYGWGVMVHSLATGFLRWDGDRPSIGAAPPGPFSGPPLAAARPSIDPVLADLVDRARRPDPAARPAMAEIRDALAARPDPAPAPAPAPVPLAAAPVPVAATPAVEDGPAAADPLAEARRVGDALCDLAIELADGVCWATPLLGTERVQHGPDLYDGAAGVALFLAALARATGDERPRRTAVAAASWLCGDVWGRGRTAVGLHSGEAGVGLLLVRLAALLDEPGFLTAAELRARRLAGVAPATTDLVAGTAGLLYFLTELGRATGESRWLRVATGLAEDLVDRARSGPGGTGIWWDIPSPAPDVPGGPFLGLAHGTAGIGLALGHLGTASGDERLVTTATEAGALMEATAVADAATGGSVWARSLADGRPDQQAWCHGAAGIGTFALHLHRWTGVARWRELADRAAAAMGPVAAGRDQSGLCHGVAGDGAFALDRFAALGDPADLTSARTAARRLAAWRDPDRPGAYRTFVGGYVSPSYMVGTAGVGAFLLRLARPDAEPDLVLPLPDRA